MFGRRPQPSIRHRCHVDFRPRQVPNGCIITQMRIELHNLGLGIAGDIFLNLSITSCPGRSCEVHFMPSEDQESWRVNRHFGSQMQMITRADVRLPPEASLLPVRLNVLLRNPLESDFAIEGVCGCAGGEPSRFEFRSELADFVEAFDRLVSTPADAPDAASSARLFDKAFYKNIQSF